MFTYLDPNLQAIADFTNNSETEQAIGRARSIRNNGNKTILILNNVVFNIEVDKLITKIPTAKEQELIERLHKHIKTNDFLVATNKRMSIATGVDDRSFDTFDTQLAVSDEIKLKVVEYKSNGRANKLDIYILDDYEVTPADLKTHIKSNRGIKIISVN